jgi:hypothetical protein
MWERGARAARLSESRDDWPDAFVHIYRAPVMQNTAPIVDIPTDFDAFLVDYIPVTDGIWSLAGIDDDRPVFGWGRFHAVRCVEQLALARERARIAEWALADVQPRNLPMATAYAAAHVARTREDVALWSARVEASAPAE